MTQLADLDLSANKLSNVNALVGLKKLSALKLDANQLTDISALVGLSQLQSLSLNGNQITDEQLVNLKGLSNLKFLSLQETFIRLSLRDNPALTKAKVDILQKALPNCKIQHAAKLSAEASAVIINRAIRNKLKKPEGELTEKDLLQVISLSQLQLAGKQLTDVSALVKLTQLTSLDLSGNKLSNINALAKLKGLAYLNLSRNPLTWADINFLQNVLPRCSIEHDIYLSVTESAEFIEARVRKKINKREGKLTWADLENVKELNLFDSHLTDINALAWLKQLVRLDLSNDFDTDPSKLPTDFSALTGLSQLTTLNLSVNAFDDKQLKHLANLKKLKTLNLSETLITDIKTLAGLKQLEHLYINDNEIKAGQLKHLAELTQLKVLTIHNNPKITESEIATLQKALPECEIESIRDGF